MCVRSETSTQGRWNSAAEAAEEEAMSDMSRLHLLRPHPAADSHESCKRDLAEMRRQINAMRQDCNTMCNALQRIEAGERDPRMIARRTLEHWSEKAALTSKEPRDDA